MLLSVLQQQKDALESSSCSWIWEGINSLNLSSLPHAGVLNTAQKPDSAVGERHEILDIGREGSGFHFLNTGAILPILYFQTIRGNDKSS